MVHVELQDVYIKCLLELLEILYATFNTALTLSAF